MYERLFGHGVAAVEEAGMNPSTSIYGAGWLSHPAGFIFRTRQFRPNGTELMREHTPFSRS